MDTTSTIFAVASPPGSSLRGIIRICGPDTFRLIRAIAGGWTGIAPPDSEEERRLDENPAEPFPQRGVYRAMLRLSDCAALPVLAMVFPQPRSYTGDDCIELQTPGNPHLLSRICAKLVDIARRHGIVVREATAGEFTARAYLNGRISLTQAEGIAATIAALSDAELRAAEHLLRGSLGEFAHGIADELAAALALVEAGIDFTDQDDVVAISREDLLARLIVLRERIRSSLAHAVGMEQLHAIPWVVLAGAPNAGKSSLFNALLGRERAIVSPIAGTTRDVIAEPLKIATDHGPAEVMLVDLAGLDELDPSPINQLMQRAAHEAIRRSELVVRCVPVDGVEVNAERTMRVPEILVSTKADLSVPQASNPAHTSAAAAPDTDVRSHAEKKDLHAIAVSAVTGAGLQQLRKAIAERLAQRAVSLASDAVALRPRHEAALRSAAENLEEAIALVQASAETGGTAGSRPLEHAELIASAMRSALNDMAELAGDITPDDVLGRIFATFCIGK